MPQKLFVLLFTLFVCNVPAVGHGALTLEYDSQRPGGDYTHFYTPAVKICAEKCAQSSRCQAFDYHLSDRSCWLKNHAYPPRTRMGVVSGMKQSEHSESFTNGVTGWNMDYDTQRPGGDYTRFQARNVHECNQQCEQDGRCVAFDYTTVDHYCYLKSWIPGARPYRGIISGVKYYQEVKRVQELLIHLQYNPGPADGLMGSKTQRALENFQRDHLLPVTGRIDEATLNGLGLLHPPSSSPLPPASVQNNVQYGAVESVQSVEQIPASQEALLEDSQLYVRTTGVTYLQLDDNIYANILAKIPAGTQLKVLSDKGEWYKVSYQNQIGYILAESVTKELLNPDLPKG